MGGKYADGGGLRGEEAEKNMQGRVEGDRTKENYERLVNRANPLEGDSGGTENHARKDPDDREDRDASKGRGPGGDGARSRCYETGESARLLAVVRTSRTEREPTHEEAEAATPRPEVEVADCFIEEPEADPDDADPDDMDPDDIAVEDAEGALVAASSVTPFEMVE